MLTLGTVTLLTAASVLWMKIGEKKKTKEGEAPSILQHYSLVEPVPEAKLYDKIDIAK